MINNSILDVFNYKPERENNILQISNSIINSLCFPAFEIGAKVVIENCNIGTLMINNTWFEAGLVLRNTIVKSRIEYEAGGHNKSPIIIENNIFLKGTNLLLKEGCGTDPTFEKGIIIENNIGRFNIP